MLGRLPKPLTSPVTMVGLVCMSLLLVLRDATFFYYLTVAQLLYIPIVVQAITPLHTVHKGLFIAGQLAVTALFFTSNSVLISIYAITYLITTVMIASIGVRRFLQRGFTNIAEILIDIGLLYIAIGGCWFVAYHLQMDTGFSPIITWLTAIHFHYSACLLCITLGFIGRITQTTGFLWSSAVLAIGPLAVALGITVSVWIELSSVTAYVVAIFYMTWHLLSRQAPRLFRVSTLMAFFTLCLTICWSFLYASGRFSGSHAVSIPQMIAIHGTLNAILFGITVTIASIFAPPSTQRAHQFPRSAIRGQIQPSDKPHHALVDDFTELAPHAPIPREVQRFYEHTADYTLQASVKWSIWFRPFAAVFFIMSKGMQQLHLPLSRQTVTMNGTITRVDALADGRHQPRLWQRKIDDTIVFSAIYAAHHDDDQCYMNIALPLPKSVMHGILVVTSNGQMVQLTSDAPGDAGTYLTIGTYTFQLPLHEYFTVTDIGTHLEAVHRMTIFRIPFLTIDYTISRKNAS